MSEQRPLVFGVAGTPEVAARSLSPAMFAAVFATPSFREQHGDAYYVPLGIREKSARKALNGLPRLGFRGVNVTMPFKSLAAAIAHVVSPSVSLSGSANTLTISAAGEISADSTDGAAVVAAIHEHRQISGSHVYILGAGGAAADCACAIAGHEPASLSIINRSAERSQLLIEKLRGAFPKIVLENPDSLPIQAAAHIIVSCVPEPAAAEMGATTIDAGALVVDLAYRPDRRQTELVQLAHDRNAACIDGREILVRQGTLSFAIWFGVEAPMEEMYRAVA